MKAKVNVKEFQSALAKLAALPASGDIGGNSIVTIDADMFGGLRLCRSTNTAFARIITAGEVEETGVLAVPYRTLDALMRSCDAEDATMEDVKKELLIKSGSGEAECGLWPEKDIIPMPKRLEGFELAIPHKELVSTLKAVSVATFETGSVRPELQGVGVRKLPGCLSFFGTNGHRLHACRLAALVPERINPEVGGERDCGILIPNEGAACILKVFTNEKEIIVLTLGKDGIQLDAADTSLRLPVANYYPPFVEALLEPCAEPTQTFTVERDPMASAVRAIASSSEDGTVWIHVSPDGLKVSAANASSTAKAARTVKCQTQTSGKYAVGAKYLSQLLACAELDTLHLSVAMERRLMYREGERDMVIMFKHFTEKK